MNDKSVTNFEEAISKVSQAWGDMVESNKERARLEQKRFLNDEGFRNEICKRYFVKDTWLVKKEAIPLMLGVTPSSYILIADKAISQFLDDIESSKGVSLHVLNGDLKHEKWRVTPREFVDWAKQKGIQFPAHMASLFEEMQGAASSKALSPEHNAYTTPLLNICNHVISEYWDEKSINRAPTRDWMVSYLMDKFNISKNEAQAVDTVTRHPKRKKGGFIKR